MKKLIFEGAATALITPFKKDGAIDFEKIEELVEFQINGGIDCIVAVGTTGENATLSAEEHKAVMKFIVEKVGGRVPVICSTGSNDTEYGVLTTKAAEEVGADGLLLVTPYYNKTTQKGLIKHYERLLEEVSLPAIIYNVPSRTGMNISIETYKELSKNPQIVGVKEASGDISKVAQIISQCGDDLYVYSGNDDQIIPVMALGGKGVISVLSNVIPRQTHDICRLCLDGDFESARKLMFNYLDVANNLFIEVNPIPCKAAMNMMGLDVGECRAPLYSLDEKFEPILKESLLKAGIIK